MKKKFFGVCIVFMLVCSITPQSVHALDPIAASPSWTVDGDQPFAELGVAVSNAGDVNGDGYDDVIVGQHLYDNDQGDEGRVLLYYGSPSGLGGNPAWSFESDNVGAQLGTNVSSAGDINGDGYDDVIVVAARFGRFDPVPLDAHKIYVFYGSAAGLPTVPNWTAIVGNAGNGGSGSADVSTAGDVNGDGYDDIIIGASAYDNKGRAYVYYGSAAGLPITPNWIANGNQINASFGGSVNTAGDVNGDGYDDIIVGEFLYDNPEQNEGKVSVYYGSSAGLNSSPNWSMEGSQLNAGMLGISVDTAGDVNHDGYDDVLLGAGGGAFVVHGSPIGLNTTVHWSVVSDQINSGYGNFVSKLKDFNGDGYDDVIIGAQYYDHGQENEGRAFAYYGSNAGLSTTPAWTTESDQVGALLGFGVSTAGDVNGDGFADAIVGARNYDVTAINEGRAFAYYGPAPHANAAPFITVITVPIDPVQVNTIVNTSANFTDANSQDTHTALWDWGDGNTSAGTVTESGGSGSVTGTHSYTGAGVFTVNLIVTDNQGGSGQSAYQYVVVYDPNGGFVTGSGTIDSPPGAYTPSLSLTGSARFGFVSKYQQGATVPSGQTQFRFQAADLRFQTTSYDWLVVAGAKAQFKGVGKINNAGNYGFLLTSTDGQINGGGGTDKFRIKIWDKDNNDSVVYDNQMGGSETSDATQEISSGTIIIQK